MCRRRSAAKRLKAELTADAAVMTSEGEDAPPVSRGKEDEEEEEEEGPGGGGDDDAAPHGPGCVFGSSSHKSRCGQCHPQADNELLHLNVVV